MNTARSKTKRAVATRGTDSAGEQAQDITAESGPIGINRDGLLVSRRGPLTRKEEYRYSHQLAEGRQVVLDAVAGSPVALAELVALGAEIAQRLARPVDMIGPTVGDARETARAATRVSAAAEQLGRVLSGTADDATVADDVIAARAAFCEAVGPHRLSHVALARIERVLRDAARATDSPDTALLATAAAIGTGRRMTETAAATLVEANMRFVYWIAQRRMNRGLPLHDLIQEGSMGLMRAAERFDPGQGVRFGTYAGWWIRHFVNRALSDHSRTIRFPTRLSESQRQLVQATQAFRQEQGREPDLEELSARTGVSRQRITELSTLPHVPLSLDAPRGEDGDWTLSEVLGDERSLSPLTAIASREAKDRLRELLDGLTPREREVLRLRFGMDRSGAMTFEGIGKRFSLSRERIRQIESEALKKLRWRAEDAGIDWETVSGL